MRINLNFRDAYITQTSQSSFRIVFDLSKMIKPRLSSDVRMYIEHFNLPEFIDDVWGKGKGDLRGYFELRCNNIDNHDFDTETGNSGNCILYTSPLTDFKSFTNNDPMHVSNFKINQNFLQDKLVMTLQIYDQYGDPYDTVDNVDEQEDTSSNEYVNYVTKMKEIDTLNTEKQTLEEEIKNTWDPAISQLQREMKFHEDNLATLKKTLFDAIDRKITNGTTSLRSKFRSETLKILIDVPSLNSYTYIFESFIDLKIQPYKSYVTELSDYYKEWVAYVKSELEFNQNVITKKNIQGDTKLIFTEFSSQISNTTNIKAAEVKNVTFKVDRSSVGKPDKTGKLDINVYTSAKTSSLFVTVDNIVQNPNQDKLEKSDELIIDKSNFEHITPDKFTYYFYKEVELKEDPIDLVGTTAEIKRKRYALQVDRDGTSYTAKVLNDYIESKGFADKEEIVIKGSGLGGIDGSGSTLNNDLKLEVTKTPYQTVNNYAFTDFVPEKYTANGPINIEISKDNSSPTRDYTIVSSDFSKTFDYNVGDEIIIEGDKLGGETGTHDAKLIINDVVKSENTYTITEDNSDFITQTIIITKANSSILDVSGTDRTGLTGDYKIGVNIVNGDYSVDLLDTDINGVNTDDYILVQGNVLGGTDGLHDLIINISLPTSGDKEIDDIDVDYVNSGSPERMPPLIIDKAKAKLYNSGGTEKDMTLMSGDFEIKVSVEDSKYEATLIVSDIDGVDTDDFLVVFGSELGGVDGQHDLFMSISLPTGQNKIDSVQVDTTASGPANRVSTYKYKFDVVTKNDSTDYIINFNGDVRDIVTNDQIIISGNALGGTDGDNNCEIEFTNVTKAANGETLINSKTVTGTAVLEGKVGLVKAFGIKGTSFQKLDEGRIESVKIISGTVVNIKTAYTSTIPTVTVSLDDDPYERGIQPIEKDIITKRAEAITLKASVATVRKSYITTFMGPRQLQKMKCMNMSLVLYDEIPEYTQASADAIKGNTYSRLNNCQFKRI